MAETQFLAVYPLTNEILNHYTHIFLFFNQVNIHKIESAIVGD